MPPTLHKFFIHGPEISCALLSIMQLTNAILTKNTESITPEIITMKIQMLTHLPKEVIESLSPSIQVLHQIRSDDEEDELI